MWAKLPQKHIKLFEKKKKHLGKEREKEDGQWGWELVRKDGGKCLDSGPNRLAMWRLVFDADLSNHTERTNQKSAQPSSLVARAHWGCKEGHPVVHQVRPYH